MLSLIVDLLSLSTISHFKVEINSVKQRGANNFFGALFYAVAVTYFVRKHTDNYYA